MTIVGICRTLDRRMAGALAARVDRGPGTLTIAEEFAM